MKGSIVRLSSMMEAFSEGRTKDDENAYKCRVIVQTFDAFEKRLSDATG